MAYEFADCGSCLLLRLILALEEAVVGLVRALTSASQPAIQKGSQLVKIVCLQLEPRFGQSLSPHIILGSPSRLRLRRRLLSNPLKQLCAQLASEMGVLPSKCIASHLIIWLVA